MRSMVVFMLFSATLFASVVTLDAFTNKLQKHSPYIKSTKASALARSAEFNASVALEPMEIFGSYSKAKPYSSPKEEEYAYGVSKKFNLPHISIANDKLRILHTQSSDIETQIETLTFLNHMKYQYHEYCLNKAMQSNYAKTYKEFESLYKKKQKAYKLQEISKIELMQLKMQKEKLYMSLQRHKAGLKSTKNALLQQVNINTNNALYCKDLYPIKSIIRFTQKPHSLSKKRFEKSIKSTQVSINKHSSLLDSFELYVQRDKEIDINRNTIGISLPLNFTSKKKEYEKVQAMYENSALKYAYTQALIEKQNKLDLFKSELKVMAQNIKQQAKNVKSYTDELLPMVNKSYTYGESSVMEYILSKQAYYVLIGEYYETKKTYYKTLFMLYSVGQFKERL